MNKIGKISALITLKFYGDITSAVSDIAAISHMWLLKCNLIRNK